MTPPSENSLVSKGPCGACGSSDACALYSDGGTYCFSCTASTRGTGDGTTGIHRRHTMADMIQGEVRALPKRGLKIETCRKFGYSVGTSSRGFVQSAPYYGPEGDLIAQHVRDGSKDFWWIGEAREAGLFGQHLWPATGRRIVVTEGEVDCMSVAQVFDLRWPVVSVPNGAQAAHKDVAKALEFLSGYDQIVLWMDNDDAGRAAAVACASLLPPGKAFIATRLEGIKDANDLLVAGRIDDMCRCVYDAAPYRPDGIVTLGDIRDRVLADPAMGHPWFLPEMNTKTWGRRPGELIAIGGGVGCGKSDLIAEQVAYDVITLGLTVGVLMLEQGVEETGRRIAGKLASKRFHVPDGSWTKAELEKTFDTLQATDRLFLYDNWGAMDWTTIEARIRYMVQAHKCQVIYLDHLTALAAVEADERTALERIMAGMASLAKSLGVVLIFVSHLATPEGKSHEEGGRVTARHFKGSRAIAQWSHFMFGIERDTQAEDLAARCRSTLRCLKDRFTGDANGVTWQLDYDRQGGRLKEAFGGESKDF